MNLQCFGLKELPFSLKPNIHFFILCHKVVIVGFVKEGYQVQADHIAFAVDDTKSVARPPAILRTVYIALAVIAASAAAVVIYFAGVL